MSSLRLRRATLAAALLLACAAVVGRSQTASGPTPWGLFSVRYDTRTSDFIYAAYGYGRAFAMVGALQNPRSGYTELLGALGTTFSIANGPAQFAAAGAARVDDAWYGQVYYLPAAQVGRLWFRATSELYVPLSHTHSTQFALSPAAITTPVMKTMEAGFSMDLSTASDDRTTIGLGPELRVALPKATLIVDLQKSLKGQSDRLRLSFLTSF